MEEQDFRIGCRARLCKCSWYFTVYVIPEGLQAHQTHCRRFVDLELRHHSRPNRHVLLLCVRAQMTNWQRWRLLSWLPMIHSATSISEAAAQHHINSQAAELTNSQPMCQAPRTKIQSSSVGTHGCEHSPTDGCRRWPCAVTLNDNPQT